MPLEASRGVAASLEYNSYGSKANIQATYVRWSVCLNFQIILW